MVWSVVIIYFFFRFGLFICLFFLCFLFERFFFHLRIFHRCFHVLIKLSDLNGEMFFSWSKFARCLYIRLQVFSCTEHAFYCIVSVCVVFVCHL